MSIQNPARSIIIAVFCVLAAVSGSHAQEGPEEGGPKPRMVLAFRNIGEGQPARAFTVKDMSGRDVSLSEFGGSVVVALFFRPDQPNSRQALADLQKVHEKYAAKGVVVLAITSELSQQDMLSELVEKEKITYPVLLDEGRKVYGDWGVFLYPTTGVLDRQGNLLKHVPSYNRKYGEAVEGSVRLALGEINKEQLDELLNPRELAKESPERKKAERHMNLAQRMVDRKLLDKAVEEYAEAVESDPTLAEAHVRYGFVLLKLGETEKAAEHFRKAVELDPKVDDAKTGLGAAQAASGDIDKGIELLEGALSLNPKPARAHFELGKAYEKKGMQDRAMEHYKQAAKDLGDATW